MTELNVPMECVRWCAVQPPEVVVLDDTVRVDLDWWNSRCTERGIRVQITGRDADGHVVNTGQAFIRRGDLIPPATGPTDTPARDRLTRLYMCAAWLNAHPERHRVPRFMDVGTRVGNPALRFDAIDTALEACESWNGDAERIARRGWSGWPTAPGVGHGVLSLYLWAIHPPSATSRPQVLDPQAVASAVFHGWTELPSVSGFTVARYGRYLELLVRWADAADTTPELVEKWLVHTWRERAATAARDRHDDRTF